jgi:hypothetical protein
VQHIGERPRRRISSRSHGVSAPRRGLLLLPRRRSGGQDSAGQPAGCFEQGASPGWPLHPDLLAAVGGDQEVRLCRAMTAARCVPEPAGGDCGWPFTPTGAGSRWAAGWAGGLFHPDTGRRRACFEDTGYVNAVAFSPDGKLLASAVATAPWVVDAAGTECGRCVRTGSMRGVQPGWPAAGHGGRQGRAALGRTPATKCRSCAVTQGR